MLTGAYTCRARGRLYTFVDGRGSWTAKVSNDQRTVEAAVDLMSGHERDPGATAKYEVESRIGNFSCARPHVRRRPEAWRSAVSLRTRSAKMPLFARIRVSTMARVPERRSEWSFRVGPSGWIWRATDPSGRQVVGARAFSTLAECQADAAKNGFIPWPEPERRSRSANSIDVDMKRN